MSKRPLLTGGRISVAAFYTLVLASSALAQSAGGCGQQLWLISTREAPRCGDLEAGLAHITYSRFESSGGCCSWVPSDRAAFRESGDPSAPTTILVHGNNTNTKWAMKHGWSLWTHMLGCAGNRPFRLVIWSWPADRVSLHNRADVQVKLQWCDTESYYLARILPEIKPSTPLALIGFSIGCRGVGGALQLLAGGEAGCYRLSPAAIAAWTQGAPRPIRVAYIAAALDYDWLETGRPEGLAPLAVERIMVSRNGGDRALKYYSRVYRRGGPAAMGYTGPAGPDGGKLEVVDVRGEVARHNYDLYFSAPGIACRLPWYTYLANE
jgi:hypothetical protein